MNPLNNTTDVQKYLQSGPMTKPFVSDPQLSKAILETKNDREKVDIILNYIHAHNKTSINRQYNHENKFGRTAEEIWASRKSTGCTDWALIFATIARQYGISTTFFTTAEESWAEELLNGNLSHRSRGHSFCECFIDGKWQLVDPTFSKVQKQYDPDYIHLTGLTHLVDGKRNFVPYMRDLDIGHKQSIQEFVTHMASCIQNQNALQTEEPSRKLK